ncbi:MAG: zf-HC2 domain-containing protein [Nitrospirae bacterium]|nr:zf-HC2 domain-containing protein [Nitrospirota bacterium]
MMKCDRYRDELHKYLDDSLSSEKRSLIEEHLVSCRECRVFMEELQATVDSLKEIEEVEPPQWLIQKVMVRVREEAAPKESLFSSLMRRFPFGVPAAAVATVVVAVASVILIKSMQPGVRDVMPPAVAQRQTSLPKSGTDVPGRSEQDFKSSEMKEVRPDAGKLQRSEPLPETAAKQPSAEGPAMSLAQNQRPAEEKIREREPAPAAPVMPSRGPAAGTALPADSLKAVAESGADRDRAIMKKEKTTGEGEPIYDRVVLQRHGNGAPYIVVTYCGTGNRRKKLFEERFDEEGRRHGAHLSYDDAGRVRAEVLYDRGSIEVIKEYGADGLLRHGEPARDWPWLSRDLKQKIN